jgi:hypothetical protein
MSHHIGLQVLRAKVRGFQAAGSTISSRISKSEKERKNKLWDDKRRLGTHCRYHLVAYGLLRDVPYAQIEQCAPNNLLRPESVLEIMLAHASWQQRSKLNLDSVKALLTRSQADMPTSTDVGVTPALEKLASSKGSSTPTAGSPQPHGKSL